MSLSKFETFTVFIPDDKLVIETKLEFMYPLFCKQVN